MRKIFFAFCAVSVMFITQSVHAFELEGQWKQEVVNEKVPDSIKITKETFFGFTYKILSKENGIIKISIQNSDDPTIIKINNDDSITITTVNGDTGTYSRVSE
ncbi:hypothetical protein [uncultured Desulfovibrio sp.]|uniref:hypothetical protein n=1 Tax=uncultured Desulfovibrio sp. TaxID=167968 RepID=UPI002610D3B9|nr:hypothetical protein [uncultured Desulfovibrio sp.]